MRKKMKSKIFAGIFIILSMAIFAEEEEMKIIGEKEIKKEKEYRIYGAPEGGDKQWKDEHSAKEFAKIVLAKEKFCSDMESVIGRLEIKVAYPEKKVNFDEFGRGRQHDLACVATVNGTPSVLCFEAKADESFGRKVGEELKDAENKLRKNENTNIPARIQGLCKRLWNKTEITDDIKNLWYQLLYSAVGTISFAEEVNASNAYFVIYQIETNVTNKEKCDEHFAAVQDFVKVFGKEIKKDEVCFLGKIDGIDLSIVFVQRKKS